MLYAEQDLWQPCDLDVKDGICLPYTGTLNIYVNGAASALAYETCSGATVSINLASTNYVIAENDKGELYTYITAIPIPENVQCFAVKATVGGGETVQTPCYQRITNCTKRTAVTISSELNKYDCAGRWYGDPQNAIAGNPALKFNNATTIWGKVHSTATNFEFTKFKECIVTKTKQLTGYELQALSIPPYVVEMVEPILGAGVVAIDGQQYAVQNGTHFTRIVGTCRSQWDMNISLTDCGCEINHECDLGLQNAEDCSLTLISSCISEFTTAGMASLPDVSIGRVSNTMIFAFPTTTAANEFFAAVECAYFFTTLVVVPTTPPPMVFFGYFISNYNVAGNTVTFDYTFEQPYFSVCGVDSTPYITDADFPSGTTLGQQGLVASCEGRALQFTAIASEPVPISWSANVPYLTTLNPAVINVRLQRSLFDLLLNEAIITATANSVECGTQSATVNVGISPQIQLRFLTVAGSSASLFANTLTFSGGYLAVNTTVVAESWQVFGYTGTDPTSGTGNSFTLTGVGATDDIFIRYLVTDIYSNTVEQVILCAQNSIGERLVLRASYGTLDGTTGFVVNLTPNGYIFTDYTPAVTLDELGIDFDNDFIYEQTTSATTPATLSHDYMSLGIYKGSISVSTNNVPPWAAIPFGSIRGEFVVVFY